MQANRLRTNFWSIFHDSYPLTIPINPIPAIRTIWYRLVTSGHRGSSFKNSFNEDHVLAICQAICELKKSRDITGPLYVGMDTHALSEAAFGTAIEVFAANGIDIMIQSGPCYTPTPVISHAILTYNQNRTSGLADGSSHNTIT